MNFKNKYNQEIDFQNQELQDLHEILVELRHKIKKIHDLAVKSKYYFDFFCDPKASKNKKSKEFYLFQLIQFYDEHQEALGNLDSFTSQKLNFGDFLLEIDRVIVDSGQIYLDNQSLRKRVQRMEKELESEREYIKRLDSYISKNESDKKELEREKKHNELLYKHCKELEDRRQKDYEDHLKDLNNVNLDWRRILQLSESRLKRQKLKSDLLRWRLFTKQKILVRAQTEIGSLKNSVRQLQSSKEILEIQKDQKINELLKSIDQAKKDTRIAVIKELDYSESLISQAKAFGDLKLQKQKIEINQNQLAIMKNQIGSSLAKLLKEQNKLTSRQGELVKDRKVLEKAKKSFREEMAKLEPERVKIRQEREKISQEREEQNRRVQELDSRSDPELKRLSQSNRALTQKISKLTKLIKLVKERAPEPLSELADCLIPLLNSRHPEETSLSSYSSTSQKLSSILDNLEKWSSIGPTQPSRTPNKLAIEDKSKIKSLNYTIENQKKYISQLTSRLQTLEHAFHEDIAKPNNQKLAKFESRLGRVKTRVEGLKKEAKESKSKIIQLHEERKEEYEKEVAMLKERHSTRVENLEKKIMYLEKDLNKPKASDFEAKMKKHVDKLKDYDRMARDLEKALKMEKKLTKKAKKYKRQVIEGKEAIKQLEEKYKDFQEMAQLMGEKIDEESVSSGYEY